MTDFAATLQDTLAIKLLSTHKPSTLIGHSPHCVKGLIPANLVSVVEHIWVHLRTLTHWPGLKWTSWLKMGQPALKQASWL